MRLALIVSAKTISPQNLQKSEQNEKRQAFAEMFLVDVEIMTRRRNIFSHKFLTKRVGITRRSLPKKRSYVVFARPSAATLIIYEIRTAVFGKHNIACLEIAIKKGLAVLRSELVRHKLESGFKFHLVEINIYRLKKTIFEIVQIEKHTGAIEFGLRITTREIQSPRSAKLQFRKGFNRALNEFALFYSVSSSSVTPFLQSVIESAVAEIGLQISHTVISHRQNARHRKFAKSKMARKAL